MMVMDIKVLCDDCKSVGITMGGCRWTPQDVVTRPDLPSGWQWIFSEEFGWQNFCPNCKRIKGATK